MATELTAPLAGKIVKLHLEVGKPVEEDDVAVIIEAIKMETPVYAPCDGVVKQINIKEGIEVEEDDVIALIE